jgi:2-methylisocitrate lyase-like PEP mutase family enzyme
MRMTTQLRSLLKQGSIVAPSCFDPFSARLAELAGFSAIHLTGFGVEATQLGAPDLGLLSVSELSAHAARMAAAVEIPILADIDTGFGGVLNVQRTIREMERAGIAGVHIEDQSVPKHCPLIAGRRVVGRPEAVDRLKAALDARSDPDFIIVARTDADTVSFEEMIERSNLYLETGADMAMPIPMNLDGNSYFSLSPDVQMDWSRRITKSINGPVMTMGASPPLGYTAEDMVKAGYAFIMFAAAALGAAANAMSAVFRSIRDSGTDAGFIKDNPGPYHDPMALLRAARLDQYVAIEQRYTTSR